MSELNNNSSNLKHQDDNNINEEATKQFKTIISIILVLLLLFLCYFIYNLIKCYLPKWRGKAGFNRHEDTSQGNRNAQTRIEFEEI